MANNYGGMQDDAEYNGYMERMRTLGPKLSEIMGNDPSLVPGYLKYRQDQGIQDDAIPDNENMVRGYMESMQPGGMAMAGKKRSLQDISDNNLQVMNQASIPGAGTAYMTRPMAKPADAAMGAMGAAARRVEGMISGGIGNIMRTVQGQAGTPGTAMTAMNPAPAMQPAQVMAAPVAAPAGSGAMAGYNDRIGNTASRYGLYQSGMPGQDNSLAFQTARSNNVALPMEMRKSALQRAQQIMGERDQNQRDNMLREKWAANVEARRAPAEIAGQARVESAQIAGDAGLARTTKQGETARAVAETKSQTELTLGRLSADTQKELRDAITAGDMALAQKKYEHETSQAERDNISKQKVEELKGLYGVEAAKVAAQKISDAEFFITPAAERRAMIERRMAITQPAAIPKVETPPPGAVTKRINDKTGQVIWLDATGNVITQ